MKETLPSTGSDIDVIQKLAESLNLTTDEFLEISKQVATSRIPAYVESDGNETTVTQLVDHAIKPSKP